MIKWDVNFDNIKWADPIVNTTDETEGINPSDMFCGLCEDEMGQYASANRVFIPIKYKTFIKKLTRQISKYPSDFSTKPFKRYAYITSRVHKGAVRELDEYLMILDTDSKADMLNAIKYIDKLGIKHCTIRSSPTKFWIVCDKIGTMSDLLPIMFEITGVDMDYVSCAARQSCLLFRAFPKQGFIPQVGKINKKCSLHFRKWMVQFKKHWESKEVSRLNDILFAEAL